MRALIIFLLTNSLLAGNAMAYDKKNTLGYIEKAILVERNLMISAKLDTGAKSASLNATQIKKIIRDHKDYLRFIVPSKTGDITFECEYVGHVNIKLRVGEADINTLLRTSNDRPVVLMKVRLGDQEKTIRVNLTNRKRFIYPLLLGREAIIAFQGVIDPQLKYTLKYPKTPEPITS